MDNFKRSSSQNARRRSSVDGFVGGSRAQQTGRRPVKKAATSQHTGSINAKRGSLGNFKQTDGFTSAKSRPISGKVGVDESVRLDMPQQTSRSRRHQEPKSSKHILKKAMASLLVVFLVGGGYLFGKGYLSILGIFKGGGNAIALQENVDPSTLRGEGDGRVNVLLLGRGGEGHEGSDLTDTIIVASIDPVNKKAALLSIPRDLYVDTGEYGAMKINSVFFTGKNYAVEEAENPDDAGMRLLEQTLEETIGIPIHYHVLVDFEGFKQAIDTVGGVTIDVPEELAVTDYMHYYGAPYTLDVGSGTEQFDGLKALMFSRTRKTSPRGDFDRSERQRLMMVALKDKVFSLGTFGNPVTVNQLLSDLGSHVSSNFTTAEVLRVYEIMQDIPNNEVASVGLADGPNSFVQTGNIDGLSVVIPRAGVFEWGEIQTFVRNALRDGFLANEDASVDVYNGTNVGGLAGRTADELRSFGYTVNTVADAPTKGMVETVLVDLTNGEKKYTKAYLERRFAVTATTSLPDNSIDPGSADFVILLGQNEERRLEN